MLGLVFVDMFSICPQIPVLRVFYLCEQNLTIGVTGAKQAWALASE
jgi:hypothetical protein